jgi:hypothetical protein
LSQFLSLVLLMFLLASSHTSTVIPSPVLRADSFSIAMRS